MDWGASPCVWNHAKKSGLEQYTVMAYSFFFTPTCKEEGRPANTRGEILLIFGPTGQGRAICNDVEQRFEPTMRQTRLSVG